MSHQATDKPVEVVVDTSAWDDEILDNFDDFSALWINDGIESLYAALLGGPGRRGSADAFEPSALFRRHHDDDPEGASFTALLLCTDNRWDKATGRLVRDIADSGCVPDEDLDDLADTFAWVDELWLKVPVAWLDWNAEEFSSDGMAPVRRWIRPPLRRWATERLARRACDDPAALLERARSLPDEHGSAVTLGLLDAADALSPQARRTILDAGLASSAAAVRRRALEVLVAEGRAEEALRLAADDPAALVRRFGTKLAATLAGGKQSGDAGAVQGSLFA